jgi:bifunctional oligoribonuclease and PAP phosphatase NrnA
MTTNKLQWSEAAQAVESASSILLVTHVSPDGDAIGSLLGLTNALRERGKNVDAVVDGGVPDFLKFLPGAETVLEIVTVGEWDLMISLDSSDEARTGKSGIYGRAHSRTVINLDHHATNTMFGNIYLVIPEAVSATEIVARWLVEMRLPFTQAVALPLLTGLVTDTRGFRTSNVRSSTLEIAQRLIEAGASLTEITARVLDSMPFNALELWKQVMPSIEMSNTVISATITQADRLRAGVDQDTDGDLVSLLISVNQAMISVLFKEQLEGTVEISLRSKPGYDVAQVAFSLGGGGHKQASGATIEGPLDVAKARVMPLLYEAAKQGTLIIA